MVKGAWYFEFNREIIKGGNIREKMELGLAHFSFLGRRKARKAARKLLAEVREKYHGKIILHQLTWREDV